MTDLRDVLGEECRSGLEHDYGTCAAGCTDGRVLNQAAVRATWAMVNDALESPSNDVRLWGHSWSLALEAAGAPRLGTR